ncbi:MAG: hypothetical protein NT150_02165, partial [Bacteroidetes bacterium]|nr:hypothetical protein [Bacteroidota bacterium]
MKTNTLLLCVFCFYCLISKGQQINLAPSKGQPNGAIPKRLTIDPSISKTEAGISALEDGYYTIKKNNTSMFLSFPNSELGSTPTVEQNTSSPTESQVFKFTKVVYQNGISYKITPYKNENAVLATTDDFGLRLESATWYIPTTHSYNHYFSIFLNKNRTGNSYYIRPEYAKKLMTIGDDNSFSFADYTNAALQSISIEPVELSKMATRFSGASEILDDNGASKNYLKLGEKMKRGQFIVSNNGAYCLVLDKNGLLAVYRGNNPLNFSDGEETAWSIKNEAGETSDNIDEIAIGNVVKGDIILGVYKKINTNSIPVSSLFPGANVGVGEVTNYFLLLSNEGQVQILKGLKPNNRNTEEIIFASKFKEGLDTMYYANYKVIDINEISSPKCSESAYTRSFILTNATNNDQVTTVTYTATASMNSTLQESNEWSASKSFSGSLANTLSYGGETTVFEGSLKTTVGGGSTNASAGSTGKENSSDQT